MWFLLWVDSGGFRYVKLRKNDGSALTAYLSKLRQKPAGRPLPHGCTGVEIYRRGVKHEHYYCHETAFHIDYSRFRHLAAQLAEAGFVKRLRRSVYVLPLHSHVWLFSKINEELVVSLYGGIDTSIVDVKDVARLIDVFTSGRCLVVYHGERCNGRRCTESSFSIICKDRAANVIDNFVEKYKIRWGQDYVKFDVNVLEGMSIEHLLTKWEQNGEASRELVNVLERLREEGWLSRRLYVYKAELRGGGIDGDVAASIMIAKEVLKKTALVFGRRIDFISDSIA
jgi:hypothetical protein